jgi:hypothetical protein
MRFFLAALFFIVGALAPRLDVPAFGFGGPGGGPYRLTCQQGVLTGLVASYGNWIDGVALICRGLSEDGSLGSESSTNPVGGPGGQRNVHRCPDGSVVAGFGGGYGLYVNAMLLRCQAWNAQTRSAVRSGGSVVQILGSESAPSEADRRVCPDGQVGVGLVGKSGLYLDSVDLVCDTR